MLGKYGEGNEALLRFFILTEQKKTAQEFLGWTSVGLVFKKGYYFLRVPKVILNAAPTTAGFWPVPEISCKG